MVRYTSLILLTIAAVATADSKQSLHAASSQGLHTVHEDAASESASQLRKLGPNDKDKKPDDKDKKEEKKPDALQQSAEGENGGVSAKVVTMVGVLATGALGALLF